MTSKEKDELLQLLGKHISKELSIGQLIDCIRILPVTVCHSDEAVCPRCNLIFTHIHDHDYLDHEHKEY